VTDDARSSDVPAPTLLPPRAGGLDWAATWRAMVAATREPDRDAGDRWERRAARFDRRSREPGAADGAFAGIAPHLRPDDVILDVGAGAGRHVVPFARACRRVVAVEPSASMRARLERRVRDEGLTNVEIRGEAWPAPDPPEADVVFSGHVLYGIEDAPAFLLAMTRAARRGCALCLGLAAPADGLAPVRARVHGHAAPPRPAALEALALLHQLGLRAELAVLPGTERALRFGTSDDDLTELCLRLSLEPTAEERGRVRAALEWVAPADGDGMHVVGTTGPNALLWWRSRAVG
jgi:SAM-dependent methyltransferase